MTRRLTLTLAGAALLCFAACHPPPPPDRTTTAVRGYRDQTFPDFARVYVGEVPATGECATVRLLDCDVSRTACESPAGLEVPVGAIATAWLSELPCCEAARKPARVTGSIRFAAGTVDGERPAELDLELDRGPLADPASVFMVGRVETYEAAACD